MRSTALLAVTLGLFSVTSAFAQVPKRTEGPGLKASEDAREPAVVATCKTPPPAPPNFGGGNRRNGRRAPPPSTHVSAIPDVIAAGQHWKVQWHESGNNADGIVGTDDGGVLVAQQDNSDVVKLDQNGHASVVYRDTNTGGALSMNKQGQLFIVERGLHESIWELAPQHKVLAISYQGDPLDCLADFGLNDLTAAANGGVYFTLGALYYAAPDGTITKQGDIPGYTNGIILSPDEKTLYVTGGTFGAPGILVAFDVQPDGMLSNQRTLAKLTGGGDGSTIDSEGRIYVTSGHVIDVISPDDGKLLGVIPGPKGDDLISVTFGGRDRHTLYALGINPAFAKGGLGLPSDRMKQGGEIVAIAMIAHGYAGRAK